MTSVELLLHFNIVGKIKIEDEDKDSKILKVDVGGFKVLSYLCVILIHPSSYSNAMKVVFETEI